jgi:E1A-binding protein p400
LAGNIRTHVTNQQTLTGLPGTIKLASNTTPQQQQAILNVLQQNQRQNASPVRLQTSTSNLVAVTVQQQPNIVVSSAGNVVMSGEQQSGLQIQQLQQHQQQQLQQQQQGQQQQQQQQQQVSMIKKKIQAPSILKNN